MLKSRSDFKFIYLLLIGVKMSIKSLFNQIKNRLVNRSQVKSAVLLSAVTATEFAHAAGLEKVESIMQNVSSALQAASVVTVTVAVLWCGYKIVFGGQTFREVAPVLIGGIIIGAASQIASMLVG